MSIIGHALARLAKGVGGQLMLELPDDLQPAFAAELLHGANSEVNASPPFALFVHGQRQDVESISPRVDFRELAMYRQGSHLAVAYASDNRGMSTYSSVYPLLLSDGFPSAHALSGGAGVAGLKEFSLALSEVLMDRVGSHGLGHDEFKRAIKSILEFLAEAYEVAGNGQSSFAADWWMHVHQWAELLTLDNASSSDPVGIPRLYGCAGLPVPASGDFLSMKPREYVSVLRARWSSPSAIIAEVGRLQGLQSATAGAEILAGLDWVKSHAITSLRSDSPIAFVAMGHDGNVQDRIKGWSLLSETDFRDSFVDAKGKLGIRRSGSDLAFPWKNALPVLIASDDESEAGLAGGVLLRDIEFFVPCKTGVGVEKFYSHVGEILQCIKVCGSRGCSASFHVNTGSARLCPDGFYFSGEIELKPSKNAMNLAWIEVETAGDAACILADKCDGAFTLLRSDEAALWIRPQGRDVKSSLRGPIVWSKKDSDPKALELPTLGVYDVAVAWGGASSFDGAYAVVHTTSIGLPWDGMKGQGARAVVEIIKDIEVTCSGRTFFKIDVFCSDERTLSPIIAAANGLHPDTSRLLDEDAFYYLPFGGLHL